MKSPESNPIGYQWLAERFDLVTVPYWLESRALERGARRVVDREGRRTDYFPAACNILSVPFSSHETTTPSWGLTSARKSTAAPPMQNRFWTPP